MRNSRILPGLILAGLLILSCSQSTESPPADNSPFRTPADLTAAEKSLLESADRFSLKLFKEVLDEETDSSNVFISPLSASYALAMTLNGAVGETRDAMAATLEHTGLSLDEINRSYQSLTELLTQLDPDVAMKIANSIWYRQGKPVRQAFIDLNRTYFDALVREIDFQADGSADTINSWVDINTNGKITEMIKAPISPDVAMILMNAIYFKGNWTIPFDTADTESGMFYKADGSEVECEMMSRHDTILYFENDLFRAVELPYGNEAFSMAVILPHPEPESSMDEVVAAFSDENWELWRNSFRKIVGQIVLPRFKFEYELSLKDVLIALGMGIAFNPGLGDFSNMFEEGPGWIDEVKQKTFVQVDEAGTEAAALTIVIIVDSVPPGLIANRPFLIVISERHTGAMIFIGRIANPVWE